MILEISFLPHGQKHAGTYKSFILNIYILEKKIRRPFLRLPSHFKLEPRVVFHLEGNYKLQISDCQLRQAGGNITSTKCDYQADGPQDIMD